MSKLTTRQGDYGLTDISGKRIHKSDQLIECLGQLDTLMAKCISTCAEYRTYEMELIQITEDLTTISSALAGYTSDVDFSGHLNWIDERLESYFSNDTFKFVYPYHNKEAAAYNELRTQARTCERNLFRYNDASINQDILKYTNRLSDLFFLLMLQTIKK